jgi:hypothetical protein
MMSFRAAPRRHCSAITFRAAPRRHCSAITRNGSDGSSVLIGGRHLELAGTKLTRDRYYVQRKKGLIVMQGSERPSGDHIERDRKGEASVVADVPERQAVTGHNVRYVLLFGLIGAVVAFAALTAFHW